MHSDFSLNSNSVPIYASKSSPGLNSRKRPDLNRAKQSLDKERLITLVHMREPQYELKKYVTVNRINRYGIVYDKPKLLLSFKKKCCSGCSKLTVAIIRLRKYTRK